MAGFGGGRLCGQRRRLVPRGDTAAERLCAHPKRIQCPGAVVQYELDVFGDCQGLQRIVAKDIRLGDTDKASLSVQALNEGPINAINGFIIQG